VFVAHICTCTFDANTVSYSRFRFKNIIRSCNIVLSPPHCFSVVRDQYSCAISRAQMHINYFAKWIVPFTGNVSISHYHDYFFIDVAYSYFVTADSRCRNTFYFDLQITRSVEFAIRLLERTNTVRDIFSRYLFLLVVMGENRICENHYQRNRCKFMNHIAFMHSQKDARSIRGSQREPYKLYMSSLCVP